MQTIKKHSTLFIILAIIAVVIASMLYVILQPQPAATPTVDTNETTQQTGDDSSTDEPVDTTSPESAPQTAGVYEDYSDAVFNQAEGRRILFFHAPWCPQCRALDESIFESTVPRGVAIFKIDYDSNQAMRQKYGVTIQTTLVEVDANGNEVRKYVAYDQPTFDAVKVAMEL